MKATFTLLTGVLSCCVSLAISADSDSAIHRIGETCSTTTDCVAFDKIIYALTPLFQNIYGRNVESVASSRIPAMCSDLRTIKTCAEIYMAQCQKTLLQNLVNTMTTVITRICPTSPPTPPTEVAVPLIVAQNLSAIVIPTSGNSTIVVVPPVEDSSWALPTDDFNATINALHQNGTVISFADISNGTLYYVHSNETDLPDSYNATNLVTPTVVLVGNLTTTPSSGASFISPQMEVQMLLFSVAVTAVLSGTQ